MIYDDFAHNPDGIKATISETLKLLPENQKLHVACAIRGSRGVEINQLNVDALVESMTDDMVLYLSSSNDVVNDLNFVEDVLSDEERKTIIETIREYFAYQLGIVEKKVKRHLGRFVFMSVGLVAAAVLLWLSQGLDEVPREVFFILFWFFGDTLFDYLLLTGHELRDEKRLAGRLASIKVEFSKTFDNSEYTDKEVNELYSEIEKDVKQTLK